MKLLKKILASLLLVAVVAAAIALSVRESRNRREAALEVAPADSAPWAVRTATVRRGTLSTGFPCLATVEARSEVTVSGQLAGAILEMGPREGVQVREGDLLARIDTREIDDHISALEAKLDAARAEAKRLEAERDREQALLDTGGSSQSAVEARATAATAASRAVESLEKEVAAERVRRGFSEVRAPADGQVAARLAEVGDLCAPFHPLYRLTVEGGARISVRVPQSVLERVEAGRSIELHLGGETVRVSVTRVHPDVDALDMGIVEADLATALPKIPARGRVSARLVLKELENALIVPREALVERSDDPSRARALVVTEAGGQSQVQAHEVDVLLRSPEGVAVSGLSEGQRVVRAHESVLRRLQDGDPVTVEAKTE